MTTNRDLTKVDTAILNLLSHGERNQADVVRLLLTITGEGYAYMRIRRLEAWGLLRKERGGAYTRTLTLTEKGLAQVTEEDPRKPVPAGGA